MYLDNIERAGVNYDLKDKNLAALQTLENTNCLLGIGMDGALIAVAQPKDFPAQVANAASGDTICLNRNMILAENVSFVNQGNITLDLNGYELTLMNGARLTIEHTNLSIVGPGKIHSDAIYYEEEDHVNSYGSTITLFGSADISASNYTVVSIANDVEVTGFYPIMISSTNDRYYGCTINVHGHIYATGAGACLYVNGKVKSGNINLYKGSTLSSKSLGIYQAGAVTTVIEDVTMVAAGTGIEIRAGDLTVNAGEIKANGKPTIIMPNGNGSSSDGCGIAVSQHATKLPINVTINGGMISGYSAFYEGNPQKNSAEDLAKINLVINGGAFKAINGGTQAVYSEDFTGFVHGGTFTPVIDSKYNA